MATDLTFLPTERCAFRIFTLDLAPPELGVKADKRSSQAGTLSMQGVEEGGLGDEGGGG